MAGEFDQYLLPPGKPPPLPETDPVGDILAAPPPPRRVPPMTFADLDVAPPPPSPLPPVDPDLAEPTLPRPVPVDVDDGLAPPPVRRAPPVDTLSPFDLEPAPRLAPPEPPADLMAMKPPPRSELAPDFRRVDYAQALERLAAGPSVDPAQNAVLVQRAEQSLRTLEAERGDVQASLVQAAQELRGGQQQAAALDAQIKELQGVKKRTPEQNEALQQAKAQRERVGQSIDAANARIEELKPQYDALGQQVQVASQARQAARAKYVDASQTAAAETEILAARAQATGMAAAQAESEKLARDSEAKLTQIAQDETAAREQLTKDRQAYRAMLKAGPGTPAMGTTVAAIIGEAFAARQSGRVPNFAQAVAPLEQATRQEYQDRVQAQLALIGDGTDALSRAARERDIIQAQTAARKAEILQGIEDEINGRILQVRGTAEEARLLTVQSDVRAAREAEELQAMAAQADAERKRRKEMADIAKAEADARKAEAEAGLAERKAMGGGGKPKPEPVGVRSATGIYIPGTDIKIADFEGQKGAEKRAEKTNEVVTDAYGFLLSANKYEALIEDYGRRGLFDRGFTESPEFARLKAEQELAAVKLAKVIAGPGLATTEQDIKTAKGLISLPTESWNRADAANIAIKALRENGEGELRLRLNPYLSTPQQETFIRTARTRGVSERDRRAKLIENAPTILRDKDAKTEERVAAVEGVVERSKQTIGEGATGAAWVVDAMRTLRDAREGVSDKKVRAAMDAKIKELDDMWDEIGRDGIENIDRRIKRTRDAIEGRYVPKLGGL